MSIDLDWETLTTGPDGDALAERICEFVHDKFQTITLPRFIKSVKVHTFEFGSIAPSLELKDICNPLPDFYEELDEENDEDEEAQDLELHTTDDSEESSRERRKLERIERTNAPTYIDTRPANLRSLSNLESLGTPLLGGGTPGIPGGTSNLHYFHSHLSGLSGTQTPLAAVAGAHFPNGWPDYSKLPATTTFGLRQSNSNSPSSRPSTADLPTLREKASVSTLVTAGPTSRPQTRDGLPEDFVEDDGEEEAGTRSPPRRFREPRVEDVQTVFRVRYSGNIRLSLTAEILLDYPMTSFVGIPLKLNITGMSFDGVAVLAYIRKRAHFCFLSPEDADAAIGADEPQGSEDLRMGGLLQEIKVESEIGQRENGRQVLKNVGKVEKFVLEQVRRIFEDELVYPSFWTFLV
jgi:distribution and morphology protein 12